MWQMANAVIVGGNKMQWHKMSKKSKIGRISILPFFLLLWLPWIIFVGCRIIFEWLENKMRKRVNKFNDWIDEKFPLG
jgi:hypothetical protein